MGLKDVFEKNVSGLRKCSFGNDCDFCDNPKGETWARIVFAGEVEEADYYICKKCIIDGKHLTN